jgi:translation elongation factor EF-Ts
LGSIAAAVVLQCNKQPVSALDAPVREQLEVRFVHFHRRFRLLRCPLKLNGFVYGVHGVCAVCALQALALKLAMHVVAVKPAFLSRETVDSSELEKELDILRAQAQASGKPAQIIEKIVQGRLNK